MDLSLCKNVQIWPTSQTGEGIRGSRGNVPRAPRLLGSILALPEYREGACRTRQVSWGYQETLSRCNRGRPGYLQPVCVCTCYAMCTIMSPYLLFPAMRIHDNCSLLFLSRASLGAPAVAQCDNAAMVTTVVWDGSPRPHQQRRQATMGHHSGMGRQPQTTPAGPNVRL